MCITRLHNFCIYECCALAHNADEIQDTGPNFIPSDVRVIHIEGISMFHDIIVEELSQKSLERPSFN